MNCDLTKYIKDLDISEEDKQKLQTYHNEIFEKAKESGLFRLEGGKLYTSKNNITKLNAAFKFIGDLTKEYKGVQVARAEKATMGRRVLQINVEDLAPNKKDQLSIPESKEGYFAGEVRLVPLSKKDLEEQNKQAEIDKGELLPVAINSDFNTIDWGTLKGKPMIEVKPIQKEYLENHINDPIEGTTESIVANLNRIIPAYKNLIKTAPANTILVTHSNVIKLIEAWKANGSKDDNSIDVAKYLEESPETGEVITEQGKNGNVYIVRHGNTVDGDKELERTDNTPLSEKEGVQTALDAALEIHTLLKGATPTIISSDLKRAKQTADIITQKLVKLKEQEKPIPINNEDKVGEPISKTIGNVTFSETNYESQEGINIVKIQDIYNNEKKIGFQKVFYDNSEPTIQRRDDLNRDEKGMRVNPEEFNRLHELSDEEYFKEVLDGQEIPKIAKLTKIQDQPESKQEKFKEKEKDWVYTREITIPQQINIVNSITGVTFKELAKKNFEKNAVTILDNNNQLLTKGGYKKQLSGLKLKMIEGSATQEEIYQKGLLEEILKPEVWSKIQKEILAHLASFGYKLKNQTIVGAEDGLQIYEVDQSNSNESNILSNENNFDDNNDVEEGIDGRGEGLDNDGYLTLRLKDTMSTHLKVWLSSIQSVESSLIPLGESINTFVPIDSVINAIDEATIGKRTRNDIMDALQAAANKIPSRAYLNDVVKLLKLEDEQGSKIANEFIVKFNDAKKELLMVKTTATPRKFGTGEYTNVEKDADGNTIYDVTNEVINVNRASIPGNLKDTWNTQFTIDHKSDSGENGLEVGKGEFEAITKDYNDFKNDILQHFDGTGKLAKEEDRNVVKDKINDILGKIGVFLSDNTLNSFIDGKIKNQKFIKDKGVFSKYGILTTIFHELDPKQSNETKAFGSDGMNQLAKEEANYVDSYMNSSATDGKNRQIWGYGLHNPFTRNYWDLVNSAIGDKELINKKLQNYYNGQSSILSDLMKYNGDDLNIFLNNLSYTIYNVTKSSKKNANGKELKEMGEYEFINSQIALFTNCRFSWKNQKWSGKFLTTPSDKTTMFVFNSPDHKIEMDNSLDNIKEPTINKFYDYFLGEYNSIKAYLDGDANYKAATDRITTREPKAFYHFLQFNVKSDFLWKKVNGEYKLRDLDEDVNGITPEEYIKDKIKEQVEQDIAQTKVDFEKYQVVKNGKLVEGFNSKYRDNGEIVPDSISMSTKLANLDKKIDEAKSVKDDNLVNKLIEDKKVLRETSDRNMTKYLIADFAINMHLHNIEMHMFTLGNPTNFLKSEKNKITKDQFENWTLEDYTKWGNDVRDNESKRMAGVQAPGGEGSGGKNPDEKIGILTVKDSNFPSKIIEELRTFDPILSENYETTNTMDGQEIITAEEGLRVKYEYGKISRDEYDKLKLKLEAQNQDIKNQGFVNPDNFLSPDELIAQAQKPVIYANLQDEYLKAETTFYSKSSAFEMWPQFTQGLEIDKLRQGFYEHNQNPNNYPIHRMPVSSAVKEGALNPLQGLFNANGTINLDVLKNIDPNIITKIPKKDFRIQMEVPFSKDDKEIRIFTQHEKMAFSELLDTEFDTSTLPYGKDSMTGRDLREERDKLVSNLLDIHHDQLLDDIDANFDSLTNTYTYNDLSKLKNMLEESAIDLGYSPNKLDGLQLTEDKKGFIIPLAFSSDPGKYEKLLLSLISNTIKRRMNGRSFILATEQGMKPTKKTELVEGTKAEDWINHNATNIVWTDGFNPDKGLLPQRPDPNDKNKTLPAQILVTFQFKDEKGNLLDVNKFVKEKDGHKFLDTTKLSPELLKSIGLKIPSQGHPTTSDMEIVGFINNIMGDLAIAPQDFTKQMGTDFDIDKLNSYLYNYFYSPKTGKLSKFKYSEEQERKDREIFDNKEQDREAYDKLIDSIFPGEVALTKTEAIRDKFERNIRDKKAKQLHNELQDIYHVVGSNINTFRKMLAGVDEGKLKEVADRLKKINKEPDTQLPSLSSNRYKINEYFENQAGKLGIAIFNKINTFLSTIEGLNIELSRPLSEKEINQLIKSGIPIEKIKNLVPKPFLIKDGKGKVYKLSTLAGHDGWSKLINIDQSASVDNAKLKLLKDLNIDKYTMGVVGTLGGLANNEIKEGDTPIFNEEYISTFVSQPIIREYIKALKTVDSSATAKFDADWKLNVRLEVAKKYHDVLRNINPEYEVPDYQGYSQDELWKGIDPSLRGNSEKEIIEYNNQQLAILSKYIELEGISQEIRNLNSIMNSDSKGTPSTILEAIIKKDAYEALWSNPSTTLSNISRIFEDENGEETLTKKFYNMGVENPILMFKGGEDSSPILPYATLHYDGFMRDFKQLQNRADAGYYNGKFMNALWNGFLSYQWSEPSFNIADGDIAPERENLITDKNTKDKEGNIISIENKSLATEIEEFKDSEQFKTTPILKPLFNSLRMRIDKNNTGIKFVEFSSAIGLVNPESEIILSLDHLREINYPLFEKLVKYTLIVNPAKSPVSIRGFIANYYIDGIGIADELRVKNDTLNSVIGQPNISFDSINYPKLTQQLLQTFQHQPWNAPRFQDKDVKFDNENGASFTINNGEEYKNKFWQIDKAGAWTPNQLMSFYDLKAGKDRLYRLVDAKSIDENTTEVSYHEIDVLGSNGLSEYNASHHGVEPLQSVLKQNKAVKQGLFTQNSDEKTLPQAEKIVNGSPTAINETHLSKEYGYSPDNTGEQNVKNILKAIQERDENSTFKQIAEILLKVDEKQGTLKNVNFELGDKDYYNANSHTVNIAADTNNHEEFNKTFQYNALHEILHHFFLDKQLDGTPMSKILNKGIEDLISEAEKPENLQLMIDALGINTTPEELKAKLAILREGKNDIHSETSYDSEEERAILNPLIDKFEFVASIMNDAKTQKTFSKIPYKEGKLSFWSKFLDILKGLFYNFLKVIGYDDKKYNNTLLKDGLDKVMQILAKDKGEEPIDREQQISKLAPIKPTEPEEKNEKTASEYTRNTQVNFLKQQQHSLWNRISNINPKTATPEKVAEREQLLLQAGIVKNNINTLTHQFTIENFVDVGREDLKAIKEIISNNNTDINEIAANIGKILNYQLLYEGLNNQYKDIVNPELLREVIDLKEKSKAMLDDLKNLQVDSVQKIYTDVTGKEITLQELRSDTPGLGSTGKIGMGAAFINRMQDNSPVVRLIAKMLQQVHSLIESGSLDYEIEDGKYIDHYEKVGQGKDLINTYTVIDPETGLETTETGFKTRESPKYYKKTASIYGIDKQKGNFTESKRRQLMRVRFAGDLRYVYHKEFNQLMGKELISDKQREEYMNKLKARAEKHGLNLDTFNKKQDDKWNRFVEERDNERALNKAQHETYPLLYTEQWMIDKNNEFEIYNNPMHLLNETYELSTDAMDKENQKPYRQNPPIVGYDENTGKPITAEWNRKNPITGEYEKIRFSNTYLQYAARREYENGELTGFVDDQFVAWDKEYIDKVVPELERGVPELSTTPTMMGYLKYMEEKQKERLGYLPYNATKDIHPHQLLDIQKDMKEELQEAKLFYKFNVMGSMMGDKFATSIAKPYNDKLVHNLDLLTGAKERDLTPNIQGNMLNKQGLGHLKTTDMKHYLKSLTSTALSFHYKSQVEAAIKVAWNLVNYSNDMGDRRKEALQWTIEHLLYGESPDLNIFHNEYKKDEEARTLTKIPGTINKVIKGSDFIGKHLLSAKEKKTVNEFEKQIKQLNKALKKANTPDKNNEIDQKVIDDITSKIAEKREAIDKIQRIITSRTIWDTNLGYLRLKLIGYGVEGRIVHYLMSTISKGFVESQDGRLFNTSEWAIGTTMAFRAFGLSTAGHVLGTASVLNTLGGSFLKGKFDESIDLAGASIAAFGADYLANKKFGTLTANQFNAKVTQLMRRIGALDRLQYMSEDTQQRMITGLLKTLSPNNMVELLDVVIQSGVGISILFHKKIVDKTGTMRPLWDAFNVDENNNLIWNNEEFDSQESHKMNFALHNNEEWEKVRTELFKPATKRVNGDFDSGTTQLSEKSALIQFPVFLKKFMSEMVNNQLSGKTIDEQSGLEYMGNFRAALTAIKQIPNIPEIAKNIADEKVFKDREKRHLAEQKRIGKEIKLADYYSKLPSTAPEREKIPINTPKEEVKYLKMSIPKVIVELHNLEEENSRLEAAWKIYEDNWHERELGKNKKITLEDYQLKALRSLRAFVLIFLGMSMANVLMKKVALSKNSQKDLDDREEKMVYWILNILNRGNSESTPFPGKSPLAYGALQALHPAIGESVEIKAALDAIMDYSTKYHNYFHPNKPFHPNFTQREMEDERIIPQLKPTGDSIPSIVKEIDDDGNEIPTGDIKMLPQYDDNGRPTLRKYPKVQNVHLNKAEYYFLKNLPGGNKMISISNAQTSNGLVQGQK